MPSVHVKNERGAIVCSQKTSRNKLAREAWEKLPNKKPKPTPENKDPDYQCGNCRGVFARQKGAGRFSFGSVVLNRSKTVEDDPAARYTPRYGEV